MLVTNVYLQVSTEVAMQMQIRALRDSDLQRDRLVRKHWNEVAMSRGGEGRGLVTGTCHPCYRVLSYLYSFKAYRPCNHMSYLLYTSNAYSEVILSFLITFGVTNYYISVCIINCSINKSLVNINISYLFIFTNNYITISYCLY